MWISGFFKYIYHDDDKPTTEKVVESVLRKEITGFIQQEQHNKERGKYKHSTRHHRRAGTSDVCRVFKEWIIFG